MSMESIKEGVGSLWQNLAEGWRHLTHSASGAITHFTSGENTSLPAQTEVDDAYYLPTRGWAMLGSNMFEDDKRLVVRLEVPGMDKQAMKVEIRDDVLVVSGEKHFERETTEGRYRMLQCAYGSFRRVVPLPVRVLADASKATYEGGVLRIELIKAEPGTAKVHTIKVA
ncbi:MULTISPECIES: Hsp20/alpha crystallin family protein [unclassified Candidatus Accumulibacter]|jgi:HSP20 family protein|uniref:Hsp20/alpha crystallin family protein n=1 Tax=unclassified Candidatus Accumulibacter TaxID=2619054 RepID=UPI0025BB8EAF|nr:MULTISPECIES: Hsp20/alpha crystallin family protein [unclassified Candidatus Accumulibacter]HRI92663.1 Hsp20/alpha crystallin family protein [Accumulibacter sp.]